MARVCGPVERAGTPARLRLAERNPTGRQGGETPGLGRGLPPPGPNSENPSSDRWARKAIVRRAVVGSGPQARATAGVRQRRARARGYAATGIR
jgi:hypothetical protein